MNSIKSVTDNTAQISSVNHMGKLYLHHKMPATVKMKQFRILLSILTILLLVFLVYPAFDKDYRNEQDQKVLLLLPPSVQPGSNIEMPPVYQEAFDRNAAYAAQNRTGNSSIAKRPKSKNEVLVYSLRAQTGIAAGEEVEAVLISGGANGTIKAKTLSQIISDGEVIAEKGSWLLGLGQSTEDRLQIKFHKLITPEKKTLNISAEAFDQADGYVGIKGEKVGKYAFKIAASSALFFLGGLAEGLQSDNIDLGTKRKSFRDSALQGVSQATIEQGRNYMNRVNENEEIQVKRESKILVIFGEVKNEKK